MASSVSFPLSESPQKQSKVPPLLSWPHLPFRRISLPTAPSLAQRESVFSIISVDSLPEADDEQLPNPTAGIVSNIGGVVRGNREGRKPLESPRKRRRTRESPSKPPDDRLLMKRKRIIDEFYETEVAYVDGLDLIYNHFLTPIIGSLETSEPLLNRSALTSIFSNFIDIWNFHNSFLSALKALLKPNSDKDKSSTETAAPPNISSLLLAHFPYLSLYTPFITSFPTTISALTDLVTLPAATRPNPQYNAKFANFLTIQEADPRCGKFKLSHWLLTIVQRCPRYLLLLKDLIDHTEKEDPEHAQLTAVHTLAAKITSSLNTSLYTHAQTLSLLALQKATPNLPFQLISPGRNLIRRGGLVQVDRNHGPADREFLLFSDCLIWLAPADSSTSSWAWSGSGSSASQSSQNVPPARPAPMSRTRSKSDAELATRRTVNDQQDGDGSIGPSPSTPASPTKAWRRKSHYHVEPPPPPSMGKRNPSVDDRWVYKGRADLVDIEVVVGSALEDDRRFEILSPGGSFAVYAASEKERDEWTSEIRAAKQQLFISLNVMNPNSTLTSSSSTNHVRRVLQALPYPPADERVSTLKTSSSLDLLNSSSSPLSSRLGKFGGKKDKSKEKDKKNHDLSLERRHKVEHWVPPVWIPDSKTSSCMRCGRMFGWRRRRHHCRLCGRCVCAACSGRTFFVTETTSKDEISSKPARACEACYETVFPLIDPGQGMGDGPAAEGTNEHQRHNSDTITSLSHLPSWLSMPAIPVQRPPQSLMAIDLNSSHDLSFIAGGRANGVEEKERVARMRLKSHHRVRSSQQILVDFQEQAISTQQETGLAGGEIAEDQEDDTFFFSSPLRSFPSTPMRKEDTARRRKRFSLPAVALHATSVTARMAEGNDEHPGGGGMIGAISSNTNSPARNRRFSLVLAGRNSHYVDDGGVVGLGKTDGSEYGGDLGKGVAAVKLAEMLKRSKLRG